MESESHISSGATDQEFLDWIFDQAVEQFEEGIQANVEPLLEGREHLRESVARLVRLARSVAIGGGEHTPCAIAGFTVLRELGRGGMGVVYLARQDRLGGRLVALKVLPASAMLSAKARQRFRTEAHAIAKLQHDHIVAVHDIVQDEDSHAYAMEWVDGASLACVIEELSRLQNATAGSSQHVDLRMDALRDLLGASADTFQGVTWPVYIIRMGMAMADALEAVHGAGLLHRDVKPSNILIRRDGTPLLSDFGLARDTDATVTNVGDFAGTAAYASPEQLRGEEHLDRRLDVYSLGVTLYHALALRTPYSGQNATQILHQIERASAPALRTINRRLPVDLQTIIAKAMDPEPGRRYQTASDFSDDLERLLNLRPIKAKPAGLLVRAGKLIRRNGVALVGAMLGGLLAISAIALGLTYFIGFPIWSKRHVQEARLVLLDPEQSDVLFSAQFFGTEPAGGLPLAIDALDRALDQYDSAVRFAPFDEELRREREVVRTARHVLSRSAAGPLFFGPAGMFPLTSAYGSRVHSGWSRYETVRSQLDLGPDVLHAATSADLEALGLLALLCGETRTAMSAWAERDLRSSPDPLIEACFGMAYLARDEYGRAYPRLRKAVEAFPNVGFLTVNLAEAAMRCGDLQKAQEWLDQARSMPRLDRFNGLARVQAELFVEQKSDDEARRVFEELLVENKNIVAFDRYAQFLDSQGDLEKALMVYLRCVGHGSVQTDTFGRFIDATERWWDSLQDNDRQLLLKVYQPITSYRLDREAILPTYSMCIAKLGGQPPADGVPFKPGSKGKF